jgi:hypothetical protein
VTRAITKQSRYLLAWADGVLKGSGSEQCRPCDNMLIMWLGREREAVYQTREAGECLSQSPRKSLTRYAKPAPSRSRGISEC